MIQKQIVERQLHRIGFNPHTWGRSEVRELCHIMMDDEEIIECVNGEYSNGFALLAATNHRLLLVDKKPFLYLTVEDVRFEQISDFNFRNRLITANITVSTSNKTLHFTSYNKARLRKLINCVQKQVVGLREGGQRVQYLQQALATQLQSASQAQVAAPAQAAIPAQSQVDEVTSQYRQMPQTQAGAVASAEVAPARNDQPERIAVYTRSRLPAQEGTAGNREDSAEVYQNGYAPGSLPDYQMPA